MNNPYYKLTYILPNGDEEESNRVIHVLDSVKNLLENKIELITIEKLSDDEFEETEG